MSTFWRLLESVPQLDTNGAFLHGGYKDTTQPDTLPSVQPGSEFMCVAANNPTRPVLPSLRHSTYEFQRGTNFSTRPGSLVSGFHVTDVKSLFTPQKKRHGRRSAAAETTCAWAKVFFGTLLSSVELAATGPRVARISTFIGRRLKITSRNMT